MISYLHRAVIIDKKAVRDQLICELHLIVPPPRRIACFVNQYPQISHTFIRREILALEREGFIVDRFALRGWDGASLVDDLDREELALTKHVLKEGLVGLLIQTARTVVARPKRFWLALRASFAMSKNAVRPLPYHLIWLAEACRVLQWMEETGASHLHAHFGTNSAEIARLVHILSGTPYSFTIHGQDEIEGAKRLHFPAKVADAAFVIAVSAYCRSQIIREVPTELWHKLKVVHCGLDADYFADKIPPLPKLPTLLSIARLSPEKGHLVLLEAFANVLAQNPRARLVLAGDGPMRSEIEAKICALSLEQAVTLTGWVDAARVREELARATCLVQPSFIEGLPVVIMEAMARGRPVISTYVAGIPELVLPGETGWLVPAGDSDALSEAIAEALGTDPIELENMGRLGRDRARDRHLIDTEAAKIKSLIIGSPTE